jgi:class 3 adenylate cyclase
MMRYTPGAMHYQEAQQARQGYFNLPRICQSLARSETLPEHTHGAALFADISGFTPLTEALAQQINRAYAVLLAEVDRYGDRVLGFADDAMTCWFADQDQNCTR